MFDLGGKKSQGNKVFLSTKKLFVLVIIYSKGHGALW